MGSGVPFDFSTLLDSALVLAGHGDSVTGNPMPGGDSSSEDGGGIATAAIVGVALLGLAVVAMLVWLNRQEREEGAGEVARQAPKRRAVAPIALIAAVIAAPLIVWTASSGGDDDPSLIVERWTNDQGNPELIVSVPEQELSTLNGKQPFRVRCTDSDGEPLLNENLARPFITEAGYEYPHVHQAATSEQVQRADECRLRRGRIALEADVSGALTG
jgi:hypothetical protein